MALSSEDIDKLLGIFVPRIFDTKKRAEKDSVRFVHYTGADAALSIVSNARLWMRNATCMNDYREVAHGFDCLNRAYGKNLLQPALDAIFPESSKQLEKSFNAWLPHIKTDTYLLCLSEHDIDEDAIGRLSMWRGYGSGGGIAFVFKHNPIFDDSDLKAFAAPVEYLDDQGFDVKFQEMVSRLDAEREFMRSLGPDLMQAVVFRILRAMCVCTKHPGFREEREWRLVYSPKLDQSKHIELKYYSVKGIPQPVCELPLKNNLGLRIDGAELAQILDRLIIGPTQYPVVMWETFVQKLAAAGVPNAENKVFVSGIPLRV